MRKGVLLAATVVIAFAAGCARTGPKAAARGTVVALVGGRPVEWTEVAAYIKVSAGEEAAAVSPKVASSLLDQLLEEKLLERAVEEASPKIAAVTPAARRRELIGRRAKLEAIDEALLRKEWVVRHGKETRPPLVRVSQLIFKTKEQAEEGKRRLERGVAWEEVSRALSIAPNADTGGTLGFLAESDLPPKFGNAIWTLRPGGTTPILPTPHGFHVFRVEERREPRAGVFEEEAPALRLTLAEERSTAALEAILKEARGAYPVSVVEEHLPFPYVGTESKFSTPGR